MLLIMSYSRRPHWSMVFECHLFFPVVHYNPVTFMTRIYLCSPCRYAPGNRISTPSLFIYITCFPRGKTPLFHFCLLHVLIHRVSFRKNFGGLFGGDLGDFHNRITKTLFTCKISFQLLRLPFNERIT